MKLPMPHGSRWAVRGLDYDRTTQVALVWRNKARAGATIYGVPPDDFKEDFRIHGRVQHFILQGFWRTLGAA
jgi:hypothetical protein